MIIKSDKKMSKIDNKEKKISKSRYICSNPEFIKYNLNIYDIATIF